MIEKFFLVTQEFLEKVQVKDLCTIDLSAGDYCGRTAEEVGEICKAGLQKILEYADKIGLTLLCSEEYDVFYLAHGSRLSEHIFMDPQCIEATKASLQMVAGLRHYDTLNPPFNIPEEKLEEKLEDELQRHMTYKRYLKLFQARIPEAKNLGVTLTIDEDAKKVYYQNGQRKPIVCNIDRDDYYRILRILNNLKANRAKKAQSSD